MPEQNIEVAWPELVAVAVSRELRDGEIGSPGGARSEIPLAAARLAQLSHAPNLAVITSAVGFVTNMVGKPTAALQHSTTDYRNIYAGAESVLPMLSVFRTPRDWFFGGGLQVDLYGNLNLMGIGDARRPKLRGPGTAGLAYASMVSKRYFIYMQQHTRRSFVDKLDHVSAMGFGTGPGDRERYRLPGGGPALVVSPLAVLDFCPDSRRMRLKSLHPGVTLEEFMDHTATPVIVPGEVATTTPPSAEELHILRHHVDPSGVLRKLHG